MIKARTSIAAPSRALYWYARLVCAATLCLIFAGGMVTSTGSGLAVPDWPLSYGQIMPPMVGGILYEHGHRMIATLVGLLTIGLAVWLHRTDPRPWVRRLGWLALGAVCAQGLLGGLTVLFMLPTLISVSHAALAEMFFAITVALAYFVSPAFVRASEGSTLHTGGSVKLTTVAAILVYVQILVGALMRHSGAGLAIPDFPLAFGRLVPDVFTGAIAVHYAHRVGALLVLILAVCVLFRVISDRNHRPDLVVPASLFVALVLFQGALGAWTVWSAKSPVPTSLHVVTGAATWGLAVYLALRARVSAPMVWAAKSASPRLQVAA